jgi:hypothetical protein
MRHLLVRSAYFLLGFWVLSNFLGNFADTVAPMNVYGRSEADRLKELIANKATIEAIALGNSHSDAIDFDALGIEGQGLARGGTDLFEVNLYAQSVAPLLPKLKVVYIAISYFSFAGNNMLSEDTRNLRIELYALLPTWTPLPNETETLLLGKLHRYFQTMSIVRPDNWRNVFIAGLAGDSATENSPVPLTKSMTAWGECFHYTANQLDAIGKDIGRKAAQRHLEILDLDPQVQAQSYEALALTVEMLENRGVRVVLFTPPYYTAYNQRFNEIAPEMIQDMHQAIETLQTQFAVAYYDAASVSEFSTQPELFFNSDHLNECGMRAFAEYLHKAMAEANPLVP